jgi:hypothetical protein
MTTPIKGRRVNRNPLPPLTPNFAQPVPTQRDAVNTALAMQNLELRKEISGRDRRVTTLEATVKELRKQLRFIQNVEKITTSHLEKN